LLRNPALSAALQDVARPEGLSSLRSVVSQLPAARLEQVRTF
jgi:hypothetical protein